jgi:DNA-binding MarR family transcriptional regulator
MSKTDLFELPGHLIRRVHQISTALFTEECSAFDLTAVQYAALHTIRDNPGVDATRLSLLIAFDRSTLGDVLTRIEGKGWILREPSPSDARVKLLYIAPVGKEVLRRVEPGIQRVQKRLLAPLARDDREILVKLLAQLAEAFGDDISGEEAHAGSSLPALARRSSRSTS